MELLIEILFYALMLVLALYSIVMFYVLMRFGQSRLLGFVLFGLYAVVILSLLGAAQSNLSIIFGALQ